MTKVILSADVSDKRVVTLSDNQGNKFKIDGGFIDVKCDGRVQQVNVGKVSALALQLGASLSADAQSPATKEIKGKQGNVVVFGNKNVSDIPSLPSVIKGIPMPGAVLAALSSTDSVHLDITLKEGLPSPLKQLCTAAKQNQIVRDRQ